MSLLLEALKKAEKAKEEAQRRAKGGEPGEPQAGEDAGDAEAGKHVLTRPELPDISQPLEILSEDLQEREQAKAPGLALESEGPPPGAPEPRGTPRREPARAASSPDAQASERAAARKVFEAKFKEPNPRLPFYLTVGALGVFALGVVGYFWVQLSPAPALVNANPQRPAEERPVALAEAKPAAASLAQTLPAQAAVPGLPAGPAAAPAPIPGPAPAASTPQAAPAPAAAAKPAAKPVPSRAKSAAAMQAASDVSVSRSAMQIHPRVQAGFAAYQSGDLAAARAEYQQVLREESGNRDALLGLAAVEMRAQRYEQAENHYLRLLQTNPRDAHAQAGLLALRGQAVDPVAAESRLKTLLASDPEANVLRFALGNQYAQQGRWADAQQEYFRAYTADPENPDFAFNLAVSLDQLRQPTLALEYYRRALALAEKRAAGFAPQTARERVQQLSR